MKCKFCGNERKLIRAHIIPAGFFRRLQKGRQPLEIITNRVGEYTKRAPVGVYDRTIVCSECEAIWQEWDNYAQQLLAEEPLNGRAEYHGNQKIGYIIDNFEYRKLKLFFISVAWRASASGRQFFSKVSLGQFEDIAKQRIADNDPGGSEDFSVTMAKFDHPLAKPILDPHNYNQSGVNYLCLYLASYIAYMKVDHKPTPVPLSQCAMAENRPLYIGCRSFEQSKELDLMQQIVRTNL